MNHGTQIDKVTVGENRLTMRRSAGGGQSIVLIHGNSSSNRTFERQFDSALGRKYQLIAFDLPGHGRSAAAVNRGAAYSLRGYAEVLQRMVFELALDRAVFIGWSLGGHILLQAAEGLPDATGFVIFGTPPLGCPFAPQHAFLPHPAGAHLFAETLSDAAVRTFADAFFQPNIREVPDAFLEDIHLAEPAARSQLLASLLRGEYADEVAILQRLPAPLAMLHGEHDQLVNHEYIRSVELRGLWRGTTQLIPAAGHAAHWENAPVFNALVDQFVEECVSGQTR